VITFSLQSGSCGNSIYVEAGDVRLLFDAGISGRQADLRMASHGRDVRQCDAVLLSHEHSDHTRSAGIFQRKFGLPVYCTEGTSRSIRRFIGQVNDVRCFAAGSLIRFGDVEVQTIPTPHDGVDSVCFIVRHDGRRLGVLTDLGHPFAALREAVADLDAMYLEANYDPDMLWAGDYPEHIKRRIVGDAGHLSNLEAAELTREHAGRRLQWLAVAHLSENNNDPDLAIETVRGRLPNSLPVYLASRYEVGEVLEV
jgi:phosphoribosyl 1,2-cyclic phosphodiesterase